MMSGVLSFIWCTVCGFIAVSSAMAEEQQIEIMFNIPNISLTADGVALCSSHATKFIRGFKYYIVGIRPHLDPHVGRHIAFIGCKQPVLAPDSIPDVWMCSQVAVPQPNIPSMNQCLGDVGQPLFFTDNESRGSMTLPEGVGIEIGPGTRFEFLVTLTHYYSVMNTSRGWTGNTGFTLLVDKVPASRRMKQMAFLDTYVYGWVPANSNGSISGQLLIKENVTLRAYAITPHSHAAGRRLVFAKQSVTGERTIFADVDPRIGVPSYVNVSNPVFGFGDSITVTCYYDNTQRNEPLTVQVQDMCNAYMAYIVEEDSAPLSVTAVVHAPQNYNDSVFFQKMVRIDND